MNSFKSFDPLKVKLNANSEAQVNALRREIENILKSYVGWYDPFCEVIQNAIDSVEKRSQFSENYHPSIWIIIDIKNNQLVVTDNGVGLTQQQFEQFLAPYFSFKSGDTRGRKGAGATYLAYGFNYIQVCT
jgi:light-regulated signal transduction histidine kinase (bacteriophytochrome)